MFIIIKSRYLKITAAIIVLCLISGVLYGFVKNKKEDTKEQPAFYFLTSSVFASKNIEIFDVGLGKVVKQVEPNTTIQEVVKGYLEGITGMYVKVKAFPDKGHIVRIPIDPAVKVEKKWLNDYGIEYVDEVFIVFPENGGRYLLLLDNKKRPIFFNFVGDTRLLEALIPI